MRRAPSSLPRQHAGLRCNIALGVSPRLARRLLPVDIEAHSGRWKEDDDDSHVDVERRRPVAPRDEPWSLAVPTPPTAKTALPLRPYRLVHAPAAAAGTVLGSVAAGHPRFPPMFPFDRSPAVQRPDAVIRDAIRAPMTLRHVRGMRYLYGPFEHHSPETTLTLSTPERVRRRRQEATSQGMPLAV
ncbi:hypothetical protein MRX96_002600 [Rhipicephalus microplus]